MCVLVLSTRLENRVILGRLVLVVELVDAVVVIQLPVIFFEIQSIRGFRISLFIFLNPSRSKIHGRQSPKLKKKGREELL